MSQKYWKHKYLVVLILGFSTFQTAFTQSLILRPSIGMRYYSTKPSKEPSNNFDPSFMGKYNFKDMAASISLELLYKKYSYQLVFTSQHVANGLYSKFDTEGLIGEYTMHGGFRQFQFCYNRFFKIREKKWQFIAPFVGIGAGVGFNRPNAIYADSSFGVFTIYSLTNPNEFLRFDVHEKSLASTSYSLVLKAGFAFKRKNVERLRVEAVYNMGLRKMVQGNNIYYHTNTKYKATSYSKGSQFSILLSMPIYLKRKP
ncbi:hypothetical protein [Ferruginibacter sp.]|nr:hypothetical protein [Ferruginibacter sp.]